MTPTTRRLSFGAALLLAGVASPAFGQAYERVAPKLPPKPEQPVVTPPAPEVPADAGTQVLLPRLNGLVFVEGAAALVPAGRTVPADAPVDTSGVVALDARGFTAQLAPFIGRPLTLADLERVRQLTASWLRSHGRPFVDVTAPPQNVGGGVVQIVVTAYRVGRVEVQGARYFSPALVRATSGLRPGQPLDLATVQADLDRLNDNPFMTVDAVFRPGAETGETDVVLIVKDRLPVRVYAGYDNLGVRSLGVGEVYAGLNWGNAFGTGQVLSYQYTRTLSGRYESHSASDVIRLPWNDKLLVFGSYQTARPRLPQIFSSVGHSGQASARYVHALPREGGLSQSVQAGFDFKTTDNNLEFAGFQVFNTRAEVDQFPLIYDATLADRLGQTTVQNLFVYSPGGITAHNTTAALASLVPGARANYVYDRATVTRVTNVGGGAASVTRLAAQVANRNLPNSEQLGGGGPGSVRGYFADTALGSDGVLFSQELRLPAFSVGKLLSPDLGAGDQMQLGAFFDLAHLRQVTVIPDQDYRTTLASTGISAHYAVQRYLDVQFDLGWRLRRVTTQRELGAYGQVSVTAGL